MRTRLLTSLLTLLSALLIGVGVAAGVTFDDSSFDAFDEDEGYIDLFLEGDTLVVTFDEVEGHLPATMDGDALPLDGDFDSDRLGSDDALALYGGLPVATGAGMVIVEVEGDSETIHEALMARLADLGVQATENFQSGGPVYSYALTRGDATWHLAVTPFHERAVIYLGAN
jgi:hypothetical protein